MDENLKNTSEAAAQPPPKESGTPPPAKKTVMYYVRKGIAVLGSINLKFAAYVSIFFFAIIYVQMKRQRCLFEYTQLPKAWKDQGMSEESIVNAVNDIMVRIANHEADLRNLSTSATNQRQVGQVVKESSISGHEYASLSTMIPLKTFIRIADRIVGMVGFDTDNYASLEFSLKDDKAQVAVHFKGHRETFTVPLTDNLDNTVLLLCYRASVFLLHETDPIHLVEYYYDIGQYEDCARECLTAINRATTNEEKSRAYLLWGLSTSYSFSEETQSKIKTALALDRSNHVAEFMSLDTDYTDSVFLPRIKALVREQPQDALYWLNWLYALDPEFDTPDRSFIAAVTPRLREVAHQLARTPQAPPVAYWYLGKKIEQLARAKGYHNYLDTAIRYFQEALEVEHKSSQLSTVKMAEYYNALAFSYQQKAFLTDSLSLAGCFEKKLSPSLEFIDYLETSGYYARTAINHDSLNLWAWSTLGEYYGIRYQMGESAELKALAWQAWQRAGELGLNLRDYQNTSEPYCVFARKFPEEYERVASAPAFFSEPLRGPRLLRVAKPDFGGQAKSE